MSGSVWPAGASRCVACPTQQPCVACPAIVHVFRAEVEAAKLMVERAEAEGAEPGAAIRLLAGTTARARSNRARAEGGQTPAS